MPTQPSDRKLAANRRNAAKSTGPQTPEGKARSSQNAYKHGLLARSILLPDDQRDESHDEFAALLADLQRQYNPQLPTERLAVQRLAVNFWRLARAYRYEADGIMVRRRKVETPLDQLTRMLNPATPPPPAPEECILPSAGMVHILLRYETAITRQIRQDMQYLDAQLQARGETPTSVPNEPTDPNLPSSSLITQYSSPITCSVPTEPTESSGAEPPSTALLSPAPLSSSPPEPRTLNPEPHSEAVSPAERAPSTAPLSTALLSAPPEPLPSSASPASLHEPSPAVSDPRPPAPNEPTPSEPAPTAAPNSLSTQHFHDRRSDQLSTSSPLITLATASRHDSSLSTCSAPNEPNPPMPGVPKE